MPYRDAELQGYVLEKRFRLEHPIGSGGMGQVWRGMALRSGRQVAIKLIHPEHANNERLIARFMKEARAAANIQHPNVVELMDAGVDSRLGPYIVMELLEGERLSERLATGALDTRDATYMACQLLDALKAVHAAGVVHRDIKPSNIFLVRHADRVRVKVLDFGVARLLDESRPSKQLTVPGEQVGTPRYMAPEQALGLPCDERTDLYAAGLVFYSALTGEPPYLGIPPDQLLSWIGREPVSLRARRPDLPERLLYFCEIALQADATKRFSSAAEMRAELDPMVAAIAERESVPAQVVEPPRPIPTIAIAFVAVRLGRRVLLVQRPAPDFRWTIPGGRMRPDERFTTAARRLAQMQTGIMVTLEGILHIQYTPMASFARHRILFLGRPADDRPPKQDPDSSSHRAGWFALEELHGLQLRGAETAEIVRYALDAQTVHPLSLIGTERR